MYVHDSEQNVSLDKDYVMFSSDSLHRHIRIHVNYYVYSQTTATHDNSIILCVKHLRCARRAVTDIDYTCKFVVRGWSHLEFVDDHILCTNSCRLNYHVYHESYLCVFWAYIPPSRIYVSFEHITSRNPYRDSRLHMDSYAKVSIAKEPWIITCILKRQLHMIIHILCTNSCRVNYHVSSQTTATHVFSNDSSSSCIVCTESVYWCIFTSIYDSEQHLSLDRQYVTFVCESWLSHIKNPCESSRICSKDSSSFVEYTEFVCWCIFI